MKTQLVVARYGEDISWLKKIKHDILVYDKTNMIAENKRKPRKQTEELPEKPKSEFPTIYLKNSLGREAHTYIKHIIDNYDNLADYTIFTQGNPEPHITDFVKAYNDAPSKDYYHFNAITLTNKLYSNKLTRRGTTISGWEFEPTDLLNILKIFGYDIDLSGSKSIDLQVSYYGIFMLSKRNVHRFTKQQYQELFELANQNMFGYAMEVLWRFIYDVEFKNKNK